MKKGQIVEGIIERVDFPNKGILRAEDGTRVIVKMRSWDRKYQRRSIRSEKENAKDDCLKYWKNLHWSCRNLDVFIMGSVVAVHSRAFHMRNRLR